MMNFLTTAIDYLGSIYYYIIIAILMVIVIRNIGDWFIYNAKGLPKEAMVTRNGWAVGWISLFVLILNLLLTLKS